MRALSPRTLLLLAVLVLNAPIARSDTRGDSPLHVVHPWDTHTECEQRARTAFASSGLWNARSILAKQWHCIVCVGGEALLGREVIGKCTSEQSYSADFVSGSLFAAQCAGNGTAAREIRMGAALFSFVALSGALRVRNTEPTLLRKEAVLLVERGAELHLASADVIPRSGATQRLESTLLYVAVCGSFDEQRKLLAAAAPPHSASNGTVDSLNGTEASGNDASDARGARAALAAAAAREASELTFASTATMRVRALDLHGSGVVRGGTLLVSRSIIIRGVPRAQLHCEHIETNGFYLSEDMETPYGPDWVVSPNVALDYPSAVDAPFTVNTRSLRMELRNDFSTSRSYYAPAVHTLLNVNASSVQLTAWPNPFVVWAVVRGALRAQNFTVTEHAHVRYAVRSPIGAQRSAVERVALQDYSVLAVSAAGDTQTLRAAEMSVDGGEVRVENLQYSRGADGEFTCNLPRGGEAVISVRRRWAFSNGGHVRIANFSWPFSAAAIAALPFYVIERRGASEADLNGTEVYRDALRTQRAAMLRATFACEGLFEWHGAASSVLSPWVSIVDAPVSLSYAESQEGFDLCARQPRIVRNAESGALTLLFTVRERCHLYDWVGNEGDVHTATEHDWRTVLGAFIGALAAACVIVLSVFYLARWRLLRGGARRRRRRFCCCGRRVSHESSTESDSELELAAAVAGGGGGGGGGNAVPPNRMRVVIGPPPFEAHESPFEFSNHYFDLGEVGAGRAGESIALSSGGSSHGGEARGARHSVSGFAAPAPIDDQQRVRRQKVALAALPADVSPGASKSRSLWPARAAHTSDEAAAAAAAAASVCLSQSSSAQASLTARRSSSHSESAADGASSAAALAATFAHSAAPPPAAARARHSARSARRAHARSTSPRGRRMHRIQSSAAALRAVQRNRSEAYPPQLRK